MYPYFGLCGRFEVLGRRPFEQRLENGNEYKCPNESTYGYHGKQPENNAHITSPCYLPTLS